MDPDDVWRWIETYVKRTEARRRALKRLRRKHLYEYGKLLAKYRRLKRMADALGIDVDELLRLLEEEEEDEE